MAEDGQDQGRGRLLANQNANVMASQRNKLGAGDGASNLGGHMTQNLQQMMNNEVPQGTASFMNFMNRNNVEGTQSDDMIRPQPSRGQFSLQACSQDYQSHSYQSHQAMQNPNSFLSAWMDQNRGTEAGSRNQGGLPSEMQHVNNQSIPGLDVCQQCLTFEAQVQATQAGVEGEQEFSRKIITKYLDLARRVSELCLDAQGLIKNEDIVLKKGLAESTFTTGRQEADDHSESVQRETRGARIEEMSSVGDL